MAPIGIHSIIFILALFLITKEGQAYDEIVYSVSVHTAYPSQTNINLTIWHSSIAYKVVFGPVVADQTYTYTRETERPLLVCSNNTNVEGTRMLVENDSTYGVKITSMLIKMYSGKWYAYSDFCADYYKQESRGGQKSADCPDPNIPNVHILQYSEMCIGLESQYGGEPYDCGPVQQMIILNTSRPNHYITNAGYLNEYTANLKSVDCSSPLNITGTLPTHPLRSKEREILIGVICGVFVFAFFVFSIVQLCLYWNTKKKGDRQERVLKQKNQPKYQSTLIQAQHYIEENEYNGTGIKHDNEFKYEQANEQVYHALEGNIVPGMNEDKEVGHWLKSIDYDYFDEYYHCFVDNGFDTERVIKTMTDGDLKDIGVNKIGHQRILMQEIDRLRQADL